MAKITGRRRSKSSSKGPQVAKDGHRDRHQHCLWHVAARYQRLKATFWQCYRCSLLTIFATQLDRLCFLLGEFNDEVEIEGSIKGGIEEFGPAMDGIIGGFYAGSNALRLGPAWTRSKDTKKVIMGVVREIDKLAKGVKEINAQLGASAEELRYAETDATTAPNPAFATWKRSLVAIVEKCRKTLLAHARAVERISKPLCQVLERKVAALAAAVENGARK